jgi:predicted membrane protein
MRMIRSLLALLLGLVVVGGLASAIAAAMTKRRRVSQGTEDDDEVDLLVIFDGLRFASRALAFRHGSVLTWYGGTTIDLTAAMLDRTGATLEIRTVFGGLQIVVPPTWPVDLEVVGVFGGVADTRDPSAVDQTAPRLVLTGWALAGGVGVRAGEAAAEMPLERAADAGAGG